MAETSLQLEDRLWPMRALREEYGLEDMDITDVWQNNEHNPIQELTTIGAEVEVGWSSLMPNHEEWFHEPYKNFSADKKIQFDKQCSLLDWLFKRHFRKTVVLGIAEGADGYHEFAPAPVNWHATLSSELGTLMSIGLLPEYEQLAMHITLGGIKWGADAGILAALIELCGGSSPERIIQPTSDALAWSRAGICGVKERRPEELVGRFSQGVEIRTLVADTSTQVSQTLRCAQLLSTSLRAKQQGIAGDLAEKWDSVKKYVVRNFFIPNELYEWWAEPVRDKSQWEKFASLMYKDKAGDVREFTASRCDEIESLILERITPNLNEACD